VGLDPQKHLTQSDESYNMENNARSQMMELDIVVLQEPAEEGVNR
jgi:hypothetical protein